MFSRRHPFLFFILTFTTIVSVSTVVLAIIVSLNMGELDEQTGEQVGVIEIVGAIVDSKTTLQNLKNFRDDDTIRAIVIRIDSPGGGVGPSQEIFRGIQKAREKKHVIASMGGLAASGGYYAASATEGIMANPGTITGSIGVIMGYTNFKQVLDAFGLIPEVFKSGEFKDTGSPVRDMRQEEREFLQDFVDEIHEQFVHDVATGRSMDYEKVKTLADGRIYSGQQAKDLGLVDRLGNLEDAVEWAGELAGIQGEISVVYPPKPKLSILEYITTSAMTELKSYFVDSKLAGGYIYQPGS